MKRMAVLFLSLACVCAGSEPPRLWDYDRVSREPLAEWRYLATSADNIALPEFVPEQLAVVTLPWQAEQTRPMAFWTREVRIPERFSGRDVWLEVKTNAPTRVWLNGTQAAQGPGGTTRVSIARAGDAIAPVAVAVACTHADGTAARLDKAELVAEPTGLSAASQRFDRAFAAFSNFGADAGKESWAHCVNGPDEAAQPGFDDSAWDRGPADFRWQECNTHAWLRAHLRVPEEIAGVRTQGKRLGLRAKYNDEGVLFLNGTELKRDSFETCPVPPDIRPGQEVVVAARVYNDRGSGQLGRIEWRMLELDALEISVQDLGEQFRKLARAIGFHDRPDPGWTPALDAVAGCLESAAHEPSRVAEHVAEARSAIDRLATSVAASPIFVVPPYLQDVRKDGIVVMWETSGPAASRVEFGKHKLNRKAVERERDTAIHRVRLEGLQPDTEYRYRAVSGDCATDTFSFRTAPAKPSSFSFLVWGDDQTNYDVSTGVCAVMAKADARFVMSVGDIVGCGGNWREWTEQYLIPIHQWAGSRPSFVAIGNHEYGNHRGPERGVVAFERYLTHPYAKGQDHNDYWYSFDYGNAHFVCLDSQSFHEKELPNGEARIAEDDPQLAWLKTDLEKTKDAEWTFVFFHTPPYAECWSGGYYDGEPAFRADLVPVLEQARVAIVFSGHMHGYERGLPHPPYDPATGKGNNTAYIITGGGGGHLDNHKYREWEQMDLPDHPATPDSNETDAGRYYKHHFCKVSVDGKRVDFEAREVLGDGRDGGVFDRFSLRR